MWSSNVYEPILVPVHECRGDMSSIGTGADGEEKHQQERLEVEQSRLLRQVSKINEKITIQNRMLFEPSDGE